MSVRFVERVYVRSTTLLLSVLEVYEYTDRGDRGDRGAVS